LNLVTINGKYKLFLTNNVLLEIHIFKKYYRTLKKSLLPK